MNKDYIRNTLSQRVNFDSLTRKLLIQDPLNGAASWYETDPEDNQCNLIYNQDVMEFNDCKPKVKVSTCKIEFEQPIYKVEEDWITKKFIKNFIKEEQRIFTSMLNSIIANNKAVEVQGNSLFECFENIIKNSKYCINCFIVSKNFNAGKSDNNGSVTDRCIWYKFSDIHYMDIIGDYVIGLPDPEFLGVIPIKTDFDVDITDLTIKATEDIGFGIFNIQGLVIAKLNNTSPTI
jgi:hypothetical protein